MNEKTFSKFLVVKQMVYGIIMLALAASWTVAHIVKGTMNFPGAIFAAAFLGISFYLFRLSLKELKEEFKKGQRQN